MVVRYNLDPKIPLLPTCTEEIPYMLRVEVQQIVPKVSKPGYQANLLFTQKPCGNRTRSK